MFGLEFEEQSFTSTTLELYHTAIFCLGDFQPRYQWKYPEEFKTYNQWANWTINVNKGIVQGLIHFECKRRDPDDQ